MRRVLPFLAGAVTLAAGLPAHATTNVSTTGLRGLVTRGPTSPVCRVGVPCSKPAAGIVLTFVRNGVAHTVKTDARGHYRIALGAGRYALRVRTARFGFEPRVATVFAGRFAVKNIEIDTGIR